MKALVKQLVAAAVMICAFCFAAFAQQGDLACPAIKVAGPASSIRSGENAVLNVTVGDRLTGEYKYFWTVSAGPVSRGQGTPRIEISTDGMPSTEITVTVKVTGLPKQCADTVLETVAVTRPPSCGLGEEFGDMPANDVRGRLDNFFVELLHDPESHGLIQIFFRKKDSYAAKVRMVKLRFDHIAFRKMDPARITFAFVENEYDYQNTRLQQVPKGVKMPIENGAIVIPAKYLKEQIPYVIR